MPVKPPGRKCITVYHTGPRTGQRCGWYACEGSVHCKKHGGKVSFARTPEHIEALHDGARKWWARIKAAKASGLISEVPQVANRSIEDQRAAMDYASAVQRERRAAARKAIPDVRKGKPGRPKKGSKRVPAAEKRAKVKVQRKALMKEMKGAPVPKPSAAARDLKRAAQVLIHEKALLPPVPDKPFEEMEQHEKLTVLTGMSLDFQYKVLSEPFDPANQPKLAQMQMAAATAALSIRVKVDRNELVARRTNAGLSLLERLKGAKLINGVTIDG